MTSGSLLERIYNIESWPAWADALAIVFLIAVCWTIWWPTWRTYRKKQPYSSWLFGEIEPDSIFYPLAKLNFTFEPGCYLVVLTGFGILILILWLASKLA